MAKQSAPAKLTGGQGFNFEDCVAARFLLGLLGAAHPLGVELGPVTHIDWQAADSGWRLDDLAVIFGMGPDERSVGVSIKNYKHVTESGFDETFTQACWEQWLGAGGVRQLRPDRDQMVLVTGVLAGGVKVAWDTLLGAAVELAAAPERLVARLQPPSKGSSGSQSSEMQRALFQSFECPPGLQTGSTTDNAATANLLRHVRLLHLDFESTPSSARSDGLAACGTVLEADALDKAETLWETLVRVAARKRGRGGSIDLPELLRHLRGRFALKDRPDYAGEWERLDRVSGERFAPVSLTVGGVARLGRRGARRTLSNQFKAGRTCVVVGDSGVGKSALVRRLGERRYRLVWLTADLLHSGRESDFEAQLGLRRALTEIIATSPQRCLVVFDGVEGYNDAGLQLAARLVASLQTAAQGTRIALTLQPEALSRLRVEFVTAGLSANTWEPLPLSAPDAAAIERLVARCNGLAAATIRPEFRSLLRNLKVFDWVVRLQVGGGLADIGDIATLTALIDRIWMHFVERGATGISRATLLKRIASTEADQLLPGLPLSEISTAEADLIPSLESDGLVLRQNERVRFTHDMVADWARLKFLIEQQFTNSAATVRRAAAPSWFRAVRLYAQRLLELPGAGVERWQQVLHSLGEGVPERLIVRDLFLEALVVANNSAGLLRAAWPVLTAGDGVLLNRLLAQFMYIGTLPDTRTLATIADPAKAAGLEHLLRVPFKPYWAGVLPILLQQHEDVLRCALAPVTKLLHFWQSKTRPIDRSDVLLRRTAAVLTLLLAREVQARQAEGRGSVDKDVRTELYHALLCSAPECQEGVAQLCLELANRRPETDSVRLRREAAREEARLALERLPETNPRAAAFLRSQRPVFDDGPKLDPWPDGPRYQVDEAFRIACLDPNAALFFAANCEAEALEVLLAVLIKSPTYQNLARNEFHRDQLEIADDPSHHPPLYDQGPFGALFRCIPDLAVTLVIKLVNFTTERWRAHQETLDSRYGRDPARGPSSVRLLRENKWIEYFGDKDVLVWVGGWRTHPTLISSMLMALERWLYDEIEAGREVDGCINRIFGEGRSAALLGVLVQLGKFKPELLAGVLRPLLSGSELYGMDHLLSIERANVAFWHADWIRYGEVAWHRAGNWHKMPHRKLVLQNLVLPLVLNNDVVRAELLGVYPRWEEHLKVAPEDRWLGGTIRQFAVAVNYIKATADGDKQLPAFHEWLENQQQEAVAAQRQITEDMLPLTLAPQCRKWLDEGTPLPSDQLIFFWNTLQRLHARVGEPGDGGTRAIDALLGGVAVLLVLHGDWVRAEPNREKWCRELLLRCVAESLGGQRFTDVHSIFDWGADVFAAECGVALLAENQADPLARRLVVNGLTCPRYAAVAATMAIAYRLRARLGDEFERMTTFVAEWSAKVWVLRWAAEWRLDQETVWQRECVPLLKAFATGASNTKRTLAGIDKHGRERTAALFAERVRRVERQSEGRWQRAARLSGLRWLSRWCRARFRGKPTPTQPPENDEDEDDDLEERDYPSLEGGVPASWPGVDPHYLKAGFAWLQAAAAEEHLASTTIDTLHDLLAVTLRTVPVSVSRGHRSRPRFPSKFDEWLFERIATAILRVPLGRNAEDLWRPIVSLGLRGEYWVKYFLSDWFQLVNRHSPAPEVFATLWAQMIRCALDEPEWETLERRWNQGDELVKDLLGFDMGKVVLDADGRYAHPVGKLLPVFERASARWFHSAGVATGFCYFAIKPVGVELLVPGIRWLATVEPSWSEWEWENSGVADALVDLLRAALTLDRTRVATDEGLRTGFISLCNKLVARGNLAALALRERAATP